MGEKPMSDNLERKEVVLVGAGPMAIEYARVLKAQDIGFKVIGRGERSAAAFEKVTGIPVVTGGLEAWLEKGKAAGGTAIVATSVDDLASSTIALLENGFKKILTEKPGGLN